MLKKSKQQERGKNCVSFTENLFPPVLVPAFLHRQAIKQDYFFLYHSTDHRVSYTIHRMTAGGERKYQLVVPSSVQCEFTGVDCRNA